MKYAADLLPSAIAEPTVGAQLSEILNEELESGENGFSRRRVVAGVAWSLPVIATAIASPAAAASPPPVPSTPATGSITTAPQAVTSTVSSAHDRSNATVPAAIGLKNLGGVVGSVSVVLTIGPQSGSTTAATVSLSTVRVGTAVVTIQPSTAGNKFTATFSHTLTAGATTLDFLLSGYSYSGKKQDSLAAYTVTALVTCQQNGVTKQLNLGSTITW